jgi:hypothetical protein
MILWDNSKDILTNKEGAMINSRSPRDNIRELNESSTHTRSSHLSHMVALIIEEASDQCSIADELFRISRRFQDHIGPIIAVEEWSSAEDMKTSSVICLKCIYNFLCSMLVFTPFAYCFVTLRGTFMHFPELTY